jgi:hypothetical protein
VTDQLRQAPDCAPLSVAELGERASSEPGKVVHELRVFDAAGGEWSGRVAFRDVHDGRDAPERIASALLGVVQGREGTPTKVLASLPQPIVLFDGSEPRSGAYPADAPRSAAADVALREPADGREPGHAPEGALAELLDVYHLPRVVPLPLKLVIYFVLIGVPVPVLWWIALPHTVGVVVGLTLLELALVFGGLFRIFLSAELTRLPRRQPVQAPSTKGLGPPGSPG